MPSSKLSTRFLSFDRKQHFTVGFSASRLTRLGCGYGVAEGIFTNRSIITMKMEKGSSRGRLQTREKGHSKYCKESKFNLRFSRLSDVCLQVTARSSFCVTCGVTASRRQQE